jgi:biotin carboxylase
MRTIAIVEPASAGLDLISRGHALGLKVIVLSHDAGDRRVPAPVLRLASRLVVVDTNDDQAVMRAAVELHRREPLSAVLPGFEYYVPLAARLSALLGLPGLPPDTVDALRYKDRMRAALRERGIRSPRSAIATGPGQLPAAAAAVGFPCVLKPPDLSGSLHVAKAESLAELQSAYAAMTTDLVADFGRRPSSRVLLEEYVAGPELSVEGIVQDGDVHFVSITEKLLGPEPYFLEVGHIVQAQLPPAAVQAIRSYTEEVVRALGITLGPFHAELRLTGQGPVLIEIAARLPGDHICDLILRARGVDLRRSMIAAYLGQAVPVPASLTDPVRGYAGIHFFTREDLDRYDRVEGIEALRREPGFEELELLIPPGESIPRPTSFRSRIAYAIFTAPTYEMLKRRLARADRTVAFAWRKAS